MSCYVGVMQTVPLPSDAPVVRVDRAGDVHIWPAGVGIGPHICMSSSDWVRIREAVEAEMLLVAPECRS